uniref:Uncharacterized protein n=1 Tax=Ditylenchus dipsaci TaxID=166011 RepID=A0A915CWX2_9BILA
MEDFEQVVKILNNHSAAMEILVKNSMETTPKLEALEYNMMHHDKLSVRLEKRLVMSRSDCDRLREEKPAARPEAKYVFIFCLWFLEQYVLMSSA